jgi:membrane protease YdiL (CAAX protease family)
MRFTCKSFNRSNNNIAIWIAIYTSILFTTPHHSGSSHHPIAALIAAFAVILAAGFVAWFYCRRHKSA